MIGRISNENGSLENRIRSEVSSETLLLVTAGVSTLIGFGRGHWMPVFLAAMLRRRGNRAGGG